MSDLLRPMAAILLVGGLSVAGAWSLAVWDGPPTGGSRGDPGDVVTLVEYISHTESFVSESRDFPLAGRIDLPPVSVPLANVTTVSVTLRVSMQSPSVNDNIHVEVRAPDGETKSGDAARPVGPNGYDISVPIIAGWQRAPMVDKEHYETPYESEAAEWSAENHTDLRSAGNWTGVITITPPYAPTRSGNASLMFTFTYYEARPYGPSDEEPETVTAPAPQPIQPAHRGRTSTALPIRS